MYYVEHLGNGKGSKCSLLETLVENTFWRQAGLFYCKEVKKLSARDNFNIPETQVTTPCKVYYIILIPFVSTYITYMDSLLTIMYKHNHEEIALNLIWCSIMMVLLYFTTSAANFPVYMQR